MSSFFSRNFEVQSGVQIVYHEVNLNRKEDLYMYDIQELADKLGVSVKTVRRYIKNLAIREAGKDGHKLMFDDKALAQLRDALDTKHRKHEVVSQASTANIDRTDTDTDDYLKIQKLLKRVDETGRTLASDEYLTAIAGRVVDMLDHKEDVQKVISLLNNAINRASLLDNQHDDLIQEIHHLDKKINGLYGKLMQNVRSFDYKKMAKINADEFAKRGFGGAKRP